VGIASSPTALESGGQARDRNVGKEKEDLLGV